MGTVLNVFVHFLLWMLSWLPYSWVVCLGRFLGSVVPLLAQSRSRIVLTNLRLCFPNKSEAEIQAIAQEHWKLLGRSFAERGRLWLGSPAQVKKFVRVISQVDLTDARPRIYVGMHTTGIEAGLIAVSIYLNELKVSPGITLYVHMTNDYFEPRVKKWRERFGARMLLREHHSRELLREIKRGTFVCISPDMDFGKKDSEFVPFFNVPTNTVLAVSRIAKMSGAQVCSVFTTLREDGTGYDCHISEPWPNFPSEDQVADTARMNRYFEDVVKDRIPQYYWVHKRFKNRPEGQPSVY